MLLTPLIILFAIFAPYLLGALFEWQLAPGDWAWWTRLGIVAIYLFYTYVALGVMADLRRRANRKL